MDPEALLRAVKASKMPAQQIVLLGSLPYGEEERRALLAPLRATPYTIAIGEVEDRLAKTLSDLKKNLDERHTLVVHGDPPARESAILVGPAAGQAQPLEELLLEKLRGYVASLKGLPPEDLYGLIMPQLERPLIRIAMEIAGGRQVQAAEMLGIHRNTLRTKLRTLGLDERHPPEEEEEE